MIARPLISVVVPVYNVGPYLATTVDSILKQTLGYRNNIEIILVNDGSTDNSADVCLLYKNEYSANVVYIDQQNRGASSARNLGLKHARGKYIHFLDGDDAISSNFYKESIAFLEKNSDDVDIVASKVTFFDQTYAASYLSSNFKKTRVIDVDTEPDKPIFHVSSVVINRSSIQEIQFDEQLKYGEDTKFLSQLLLRKKKYGVLRNTRLYYRKRSNEGSMIAGKLHDRNYFSDAPRLFLNDLLNMWATRTGEPHRYVQHLIMNDIAWKLIEEKKQYALTGDEQEEYKRSIYSIVEQIQDEVILTNTLLNIDQKLFLLKKKGCDIHQLLQHDAENCSYKNIPVGNITSNRITLDFIHCEEKGQFTIEGSVWFSLDDIGKYYLKTSKGSFPLQRVKRSQLEDSFLGDNLTNDRAFEVTVCVDDTDSIEALFIWNDTEETHVPITTNQFTGLGPLNNTYKRKGNSLIRKRQGTLTVVPNSRENRIVSELRFMARTLVNFEIQRASVWLKKNIVNLPAMWLFMPKIGFIRELAGPFGLVMRSAVTGIRDVAYRLIYFSGMYKTNRPIWLVSDRGTVAGDNGEALFRYIMDNEQPDADVYFVISKKSPDYERLKKIGKVVDIDSFRYKMFFLRADKIISSAADYYVYNAFGYRWPHFNDLYNFDFVFLQHGITKDDMSGWLNRFEKNITLFVTAARPEYESILKYDYYYEGDKVLLSGFPRFDLLESHPKNKLMLAPTWRQNILPEERHGTSGIRARSDTFKNTEYYQFYNRFMNDKQIINALKAANMTGWLYLHPAFSRQTDDFVENEYFKIKRMPYDYREAFAESNMLVTDYSSVAFDFAYLQKPIIYTQFDKDTLYENHIYTPGYFSYEQDGFGPVTYSYESTVKEVVAQIKQKSPRMSERYLERTKDFFYQTDKNNARRVYGAICQIGHNNTEEGY